ncbi:MAG: class I SAM-dependent methyltransferase [Anaerolineales bacterium]|nr:class I SAM-dependent methyltransferase [Anaerolineales bacterium]
MTDETFARQVAQSKDYNFVAFSRDKAYREANQQLLSRAFAGLPEGFFQVDLASGTGLVPQEMSRLCQENGKTGSIIGIEPDPFALENARQNTPSTPVCRIQFLEGKAQEMDRLLAGKIPPGGVDYISIHDALHEVEEEDKQNVLGMIAKLLIPGGVFTYNSAFTTAALEQAALPVGRWKARAFAILGGKRSREVKGLITHTPEEYKQMIVNAGLSVIHEAKRSVRMSRQALATIAQYPRFIYGVFADLIDGEKVSLEEKSRALVKALDDLDITEIPRVWHELIARKPLGLQAG